MGEYLETMERIQRERVTEEKVRSLDADDIVCWIHRLEDQVERGEGLLDALEAALLKMESDEVQIDGEWGGCRSIAEMEAQDDIAGEILQARAAIAKAKGES